MISCLLDRSGSMSSCLSDTIGGYNSFLETSEQSDRISLYLFDHEFAPVYENVLISEAEKLSNANYVPRGSTALLDSMKKIIELDEETKTVVIITDGDENASKNTTFEDISKMIEAKKELGWKFIFMGANQDAIATASKMNIKQGSTLQFSTDSIQSAFRSASSAIKRGGAIEFTELERALSYNRT